MATHIRLIKYLVLSVIIAVPLLVGCSGGSSGTDESVDLSDRLHMVASLTGTLSPTDNDGQYILTMTGVLPEMIWFTDRPARNSGEESVAGFVDFVWQSVYSQVSPNAILQFFTDNDAVEGIHMAISDPEYDAATGSLVFTAEILNSTLTAEIDQTLDFRNAVMTILNNTTSDDEQSTFAQFSQTASLSQADAADGSYILTMKNVDPEVYWVNNAPGRYSFVGSIESFLAEWDDQFGNIPPNAVVYGTSAAGELYGYFLILSSPVYDADTGTLTYRADPLDSTTADKPDLNYAVAIIDTGGGVTTRWRVSAKGAGYELTINDKPIRLKGICYAPSPINFSNKEFPAVGDLFWDSYDAGNDTMIWNWYSIWGKGALQGTPYYARGDLELLRSMGVNAIRVYSMISRQGNPDGSIPAPGTGHHFTHEDFLNMAYNNGKNPIYVLVDIPMPDSAFRKDIPPDSANKIPFWEYVLDETTRDLADHPAVIGFNIMNEQDAPPVFPGIGLGPPDANSDYFFSQSKKYADLVKKNAPDKLVGWAVHDAPRMVWFGSNFPETGQKYFEMLTSFDFWGVNSYQTENMASVLGPGDLGDRERPYGRLDGSMRKPVILTEFGWPATGHNPQGEASPNGQITESATTHQKTATVVTRMYPNGYSYGLLIGAFYFEFSDEWWKQTDKTAWNGTTAAPVTFPNKYWDEEGFGLFSVQRAGGRVPTDNPWNEQANAPTLPQDVIVERKEITKALKDFYQNLD